MDDPLRMRGGECFRDLDGVRQTLIERERTAGQPCGQRLALDELHDQEFMLHTGAHRGPPHVVKHADPRVCQPGDGAGLALEALTSMDIGGQIGRQDLDRDVAIQSGVPRAVDLAHPACAEQLLNLERAESCARRERGGRCRRRRS